MQTSFTPAQVARLVRTVDGFTAGVKIEPGTQAQIDALLEFYASERRKRAIAERRARAFDWPLVERRRNPNVTSDLEVRPAWCRRAEDRRASLFGDLS